MIPQIIQILNLLFWMIHQTGGGGFLDDRWGGFLDDTSNRWGGFLDDSGGVFWMIHRYNH